MAGITVALLCNALVMGVISLSDQATRFLIRFLVGGLDVVRWESVTTLLPYALAGLAVSLVLAKSVTVLSLGDDVARGLGLPVRRIRILAILAVTVLAGAAVAAAGPIAMVGLLVPHVVRWIVGSDYQRIIPVCIVFGALLLVLSDILARLILHSPEVPVGVMTAILGTPYFIYLARRAGGHR